MRVVILFTACCCFLVSAMAEDNVKQWNLSADFNFYPYLADVKDGSEFTLAVNAGLPAGFSYFSFTSFGDVFSTRGKKFLITEQNFRWQPSTELPLDLVVQYGGLRGDNNDRLQIGSRWRLSETGFLKPFYETIHAVHTITFFAKRFDDSNDDIWQMEHFFSVRFPYISNRLYLLGFLDQTFELDPRPGIPDAPIIAEAQLGYRLFGNLHATAEYRINEFRRRDVNNVAIGFEFKTRW